MNTTRSREQVEQSIRTAFAGVVLGKGVSLRQAEVIDNYGEGVTESEFRQLPASEVTNSWEEVPWGELEKDNVAHLDPEGFRYYIPAFMLSVIECYEATSVRVIGTLSSLYPDKYVYEYHLPRYNLLTYEQKQAIAMYLEALPELVSLDDGDLLLVEMAMQFWKQYLPIQVVGALDGN